MINAHFYRKSMKIGERLLDNNVDQSSQVQGDTTPMRKMPNQQRSRERVEKILNCAVELIAQSGSDAMRMNEVARLAGISIGSLYQYFPDKSAIIQTLAERYNALGRDCIKTGLAHVRTANELCVAFGALVDEYYEMFLAEPVMRDIWSGTQADKALREIELANSRDNGGVLAEVLTRLRHGSPKVSEDELAASALLVMHLGEATVRLAISVERVEGEQFINSYKEMAQTELRRIVSP